MANRQDFYLLVIQMYAQVLCDARYYVKNILA